MRLFATAALAFSVWASWAAWRGPPPQTQFKAPATLARPPSAETIATLRKMSEQMTAAIQRASAEMGRPIEIHELEGRDASGQPFLATPIPDNPLINGVSTVIESCGSTVYGKADWVYCPSSGEFTATVPNPFNTETHKAH